MARQPVSPPPLRGPVRGSLLQTVPTADADPGAVIDPGANTDRWQAGVVTLPVGNGAIGAGGARLDPALCGDDWPGTAVSPFGGEAAFCPAMLSSTFTCAATGLREGELDDLARARLRILSSKLLAAATWCGGHVDPDAVEGDPCADAKWLGDAGVTDLGAGATFTMRDGLAALEEAIGNAGMAAGAGLIHMSVQAGSLLASNGVISPDGAVLRTDLGTLVVVDAGYTGAGPGCAAPPEDGSATWMYATGPAYARLGAIETFPPLLDRRTNSWATWAYRLGLLVFDPHPQAAVQVDPARRA